MYRPDAPSRRTMSRSERKKPSYTTGGAFSERRFRVARGLCLPSLLHARAYHLRGVRHRGREQLRGDTEPRALERRGGDKARRVKIRGTGSRAFETSVLRARRSSAPQAQALVRGELQRAVRHQEHARPETFVQTRDAFGPCDLRQRIGEPAVRFYIRRVRGRRGVALFLQLQPSLHHPDGIRGEAHHQARLGGARQVQVAGQVLEVMRAAVPSLGVVVAREVHPPRHRGPHHRGDHPRVETARAFLARDRAERVHGAAVRRGAAVDAVLHLQARLYDVQRV